MTAQQLRDLFFQTGLPEAYVLFRRRQQRERTGERGEGHAAHHPGDRPPGSQL